MDDMYRNESAIESINARLKEIQSNGGVESEIKRINILATDFRQRISDLPFEIETESLSNSLTAISCSSASALEIVDLLKNEYGIWVNPNGGELSEKMFRVGHIGDLTIKDNDKLIEALFDLKEKGVI